MNLDCTSSPIPRKPSALTFSIGMIVCVLAPVDQVMAESKAREQKGNNAEGLNLGDQDRDVKNALVNSNGATNKQIETPQAEQGSEDEETHGNGQETPQGTL